ncbi:MAG: sodium:proton antiporter [Lachnospiraceae bacterium]|nr:sodium:proton antiporter [Lachnospiraceae bacterium]
MDFVMNFPFFSIMLCMFAALATFMLGRKAAGIVAKAAISITLIMSVVLTAWLHMSGESFVYMMGHFPAPWGNEIRAGELEGIMAVFTCIIALLSMTTGKTSIRTQVDDTKQNLFYLITCLMEASLLALIYTNDIFTGYVFIEINTIAGCGLIMIKNTGRAIASAVRYMVVSLVGSGLFLIGTTLLYSITGHLLMENIFDSVSELFSDGSHIVTLTIITALMTVGLSIKSGLFPFHLWIPDAYAVSIAPSSAMLSGMVSKGYIFLLIKLIYRVIGFEVFKETGVFDLIFIAGVAAMIMGSVSAIRSEHLRRMTAYSSVSQIGYIFMGIGIANDAGMVAAIFHIITHGLTKSLLFMSASSFTGKKEDIRIRDIKGMGHKHPVSSAAFTAAALSIVGFPLFAGFIAKMLLANASFGEGYKMYIAICAIAISTILNVIYFFRCIINLYAFGGFEDKDRENSIAGGDTAKEEAEFLPTRYERIVHGVSVSVLAVLNLYIGVAPKLLTSILTKGLNVFN